MAYINGYEILFSAIVNGGNNGNGNDGNSSGIVSIERTSGNGAAGTTDTYTITYTDGTTTTFTVYNGKDGKDYVLTDDDKNEIANLVINILGGYPVVGVVDSDKHITLSGNLPVGKYTLNYEGDNGEYSDIVNFEITEEDKVSYTNVLPLAQEYASNSPYIGSDGSAGYGNNMRISASSPTTTYMKALTGVDVVALIPVKRGDILRFKNCNVKVSPSNANYGTHLLGFDSSKAPISAFSSLSNNIQDRLPCVVEGDEIVQITLEPKETWTTSEIDRVAYIMLATDGIDETSIITINQEIV